MSKKIIFFIALFHVLFISTLVSADLIPIKKPSQTKEETQKKLLSDSLIPVPKPIKKNEIEITQKKELDKDEKTDFTGLILPKKKPVIAGKEKKTQNVKISKYYSKKDFNLANKAISEMKKGQWSSALKISKKAKDKSIYNFIQWRHLITKGNKASFYDYKTFIDKNETIQELVE